MSIECGFWDPTQSQKNVFIIFMETTNLLSIAGAGFVLLTYLIFWGHYPHKLPFWLALSCFMQSLFMLISPLSGFAFILGSSTQIDNSFCLGQAIGIQFFANATNFWSLVLFLHMHSVVANGHSSSRLDSIWSHLVVWAFAAILTIVPAVLGLLGANGPWCWLRCARYDVWGVSFYFLEMFVVVLIQVVLWIRMYRALARLRQRFADQQVRSASRTLIIRCTLFVWLYFFIFLLMAVHRILEIFTPNSVLFFLEVLDVTAASSMGFVLPFCVFGLTHENKQLWLNWRPSCFNKPTLQPYLHHAEEGRGEEQAENSPLLSTPINASRYLPPPPRPQSSMSESEGGHYSGDSSLYGSSFTSEGFGFADVEFKTPPTPDHW